MTTKLCGQYGAIPPKKINKIDPSKCNFFFSALASPDDVDELSDRDVIRDEELDLVEDREGLLAVVTLDDDGDLGRVELADGLGVLDAPRCKKRVNSRQGYRVKHLGQS